MPKQSRKRRHAAPQQPHDEPKPKFRPFNQSQADEEEKLTEILFGGPASFLKSLEEAANETKGPGGGPTGSSDSGVGEDDDSDNSEVMSPPSAAAGDTRAPAWVDEDDGIEVGAALDSQGRKLPQGGRNDREGKYSSLLRHKFNSVVGTPSWAALDHHDDARGEDQSDGEEDGDVLKRCAFVKGGLKGPIGPNSLDFKKVRDVNSETYSEGPFVNSLEFHPTSSVAMVAGSNGIVSLYAVDGNKNSKLHSVAFKNFNVRCARFAQRGNEAILGSQQGYMYSYDLMSAKSTRVPLPSGMTHLKKFTTSPDWKYLACCGKWGEVHLLCSLTKERIAILKQDQEVTSLEFDPNTRRLYGHGATGEVTIWDLSTRRVQHRFEDEGCLRGSALAIPPSGQFVAAGSAQGVVNLYDAEEVMRSRRPKPRRVVLNLTTGVSDLAFNGTSELLAFTSGEVPNAVKLLHVASGSVFSNFPQFGSKFGHVDVVNFSPGSGFLGTGNRKSTAALFRLKHYGSY